MSSTSKTEGRRAPQQARAALRRAALLAAAADLLGERGYEAVTMTEIAEKAEASIGTLYDYFPDKASVALALMEKYTGELEVQWDEWLSASHRLGRKALADLFVDGTLRFLQDRPAYLPLMGAPVRYARSRAQRRPLRLTFARSLQALNPRLEDDRALIQAEVITQLIKGLVAVYREVLPREREQVAAEFKKLMRLYVAASL